MKIKRRCFMPPERSVNKENMQAEMAAEAARVEEAARLKAIRCQAFRHPTDHAGLKPASVCTTARCAIPPRTLLLTAAARHLVRSGLSRRPLRADFCLRFPQFEVMLETDLKRDSLRPSALAQAWTSQVNASAPTATPKQVRAQVNTCWWRTSQTCSPDARACTRRSRLAGGVVVAASAGVVAVVVVVVAAAVVVVVVATVVGLTMRASSTAYRWSVR